MANEILFKKGSYSDFKTKVLTDNKAVEGALYLTEDEGGLYLGLNGGTVKRIQGSVIFYESVLDFQNNVEPPYSSDVIYFISNSNALIRWDASATNADGSVGRWVQLNATQSDVTSSLTSLQNQINQEILDRKATDKAHDTAIGQKLATSEFNTYKTTNDAAVVAAKEQADKGVTDAAAAASAAKTAQDAADVAQTKANSAYELAGTKVTMAQVEAKDYATKTEAQGYAKAVQGETSKTVKDALDAADAADSKATTAGNTADAAQTKANSAYTLAESKATLQDVKDLDYATKAEAQGYANDVLGTSEDSSTENTVYGAKKAAAEALSAAQGAQRTADTAVTNAATAQTTAENAATAASNANDNANTRVLKTDFADFQTTNSAAIADAKKTGTDAASAAKTAQQTADGALQRTGGAMTGTITMGTGAKITGLATPTEDGDAANKAYVDSAETKAKEYADSILAANDAMTFKDVVNVSDDLPTSGVQKGDTYKVGTAGTYAGITAKVGDLLINNAEDNATPNWVHVSSGYEDDYLQKLINSDGVIQLTDGVSNTGNFQGGFKLVAAANTNLSFAVSTENNIHTITANMTWGSF